MIKKEDLEFYPYDPALFLDSEEMILGYLQDAINEGEKEFLEALEAVSRALGMTELSKRTGIPRESLYKTLNGKTKPRYESIQKILAGLNLKFSIVQAG